MKKFQPPRGTRDCLPEDMKLRQRIMEACRAVFEGYGYGEIGTPAFEDFELLAKKAGPDIENEIYAFKDKSGRSLGLRFDPTVPVCRVVASNPNLPKPIKLYYLTNMWRYDRPQRGRWREFWQAGVELIGSPRMEADVEVVLLVNDCLKALGIRDFYFKVNSREIAERMMINENATEKQKIEMLRAMDKADKIGNDGVKKELMLKGVPTNVIDGMFKQIKRLSEASGNLQNLLNELKGMSVNVDVGNVRIVEAISTLKKRGIKVMFQPQIVRGIDYYTGFVFETFISGKEDLGSVASGGRYDSLVGLYGGGDLPATGFGIGVDRLMEVLGPGEKAVPKAIVIAVNESLAGKAIDAAGKLRSLGIACETDLMGRNMRKQLEYANSRGIPWAVFVGEKELKSGLLTLRDMKSGREEQMKPEAIAKRLS